MDSCIPKAVLPTRYNLPWLNKEIVQLIQKRNLLFKRAHKSGNKNDQEKFKQFWNKVVSKLRYAKKEFWKLVKSVKSKSNTLPALKHGNTVATSDLEKANLLNKVVINSFNHSTPILDSTDLPSTDPNGLPEPLMCTEDEVFEMLSTLDTTKSSA